jgi:Domain of unknown function (DUF4062)
VTDIENQSEIIYSVFVSSTTGDLMPYRVRARDLILTYNLRLLEMEYFPAESRNTADVLHRYLDDTDAVILIAGAQYGSLLGATSYVEWEFNEATGRGIPVVCLIMADDERAMSAVTSSEDRKRQEQFIRRLKQHSKIAEFTRSNFDAVLAGALRLLPGQLDRSAGMVRVSAYNDLKMSMASHVQELQRYKKFLRFLTGTALVQSNILHTAEVDKDTMVADTQRVMLDRLLNLIYSDLANRPVTTDMIESLIGRLIDRLQSFTTPAGFVPDSFGELEACIQELFGRSLTTLKATSIHSNDEALYAYRGYWHDDELGPYFKSKNDELLGKEQKRLLRIFACDSIAESVAESWFTDTVVGQVSQGAVVKVVEIDKRKVAEYEDFGLYEHNMDGTEAGTYLLMAPRLRNLHQRLSTAITANADAVSRYSEKFNEMWEQSVEPLEIIREGEMIEAANIERGSHGTAKISDLFGRRVILRKMERLDTKERLLASNAGVARKYQIGYAQALSRHLKRRFPDVRNVIYVGDTHKNDGTAIRNLQKLGWDASGFICEPKLGIGQLWFNNVLYTDRWTDLVAFAEKVKSRVGRSTIGIFDIDQTLWAPKGIHEGPLTSSRTRAMLRLIDGYIGAPDAEVGRRARQRIAALYEEISEVKYLPLTLDNEDFKAVVCVFLSLNLMFDQHRLEGGREEGAAFFEEIGRMDTDEYVDKIKKEYLPTFLRPDRDGEANITHLIMETLSTAQTYQYSLYGETNGILVPKVVEHLREVFRETVGVSSVQYRMFRSAELEEALGRIGSGNSFDDQLVLSKPAWDFASWLGGHGAALLALSDRPDESTVSPSGESLLDAEMTIYGSDIAAYLARIA